MKKIIIISSLILAACSHTTQTTSGQSFLSKYDNISPSSNNENSININKQVRKAASVEPILKFPARIGLARIDRGRLTNIPEEEIEAWLKTRDKLGNNLGEFIPVNPLIAEMVSSNVSTATGAPIKNAIQKIRLGAARQHLDAVLIYEVYGKTHSSNNILSIANLTIIGGYILPSQAINAEGFANALLIDVIQGYPYGTAKAVLEKQEVYTTRARINKRRNEVYETVKTKSAIKLASEVEAMFQTLQKELSDKKA